MCWRFYCPEHGDGNCRPCAERIAELARRFGGPKSGPSIPREELVKVVSIAQSKALDDCVLTLISLENYRDSSVLRLQIRSTGELDNADMLVHHRRSSETPFKLEDDLGTSYLVYPSGGHGDGHVWYGDIKFEPSIPNDASSVTVSARLPLTAADGQVEGPTVRFDISLGLRHEQTQA
jgi:hypothetical protein